MFGQKRAGVRCALSCFVWLMTLSLGACQPKTILRESTATQIVKETIKETVIVGEIGAPAASPTPTIVATAAFREAMSSEQRISAPQVTTSDQGELADRSNAFAFDLYHALRDENENLLCSPYSISLALAMVYAGARGETAQQMADTLHFTLPPERLHPAFNALDLKLATRSTESVQLNVANALWGQTGYSFLPEYLDTLALYYGAGVQLLDIRKDPQGAVDIVNEWTSHKTAGRIPKVLDSLSRDTRLLLTNAIYLNAAWEHTFQETATREESFYLLDGGEVTLPMMHQTNDFRYTEGEGYQAIELSYSGAKLAMVIVLPETGRFQEIEAGFTNAWLRGVLSGLARQEVILTMPKFSFETPDINLKGTLSTMGMSDAFTEGQADLSGMDGTHDLYIGEVKHKAFIDVHEKGTEAAAVTVVIVEVEVEKVIGEPEPIVMRIDRLFLFTIRDTGTGATLFVGRVMDPTVR